MEATKENLYSLKLYHYLAIYFLVSMPVLGKAGSVSDLSQGDTEAPAYIIVTQSGSNPLWEQKGLSWNQIYLHSKSTQNIDDTYPMGSQLQRSRYNMFASLGVPEGTIYHIYDSKNTVSTGTLVGQPTYTLVTAQDPDGELSVIYTARRGEETEVYQNANGVPYQAFDAQCTFGSAGYEGARQEGHSPSLGNRITFLWEGGGFGPGYNPSMNLPEGYLQRLEHIHTIAKKVCEDLRFSEGDWYPKRSQ